MERMSEKLGVVGGNMGETFDDGVFDGVKKITVGTKPDCVTYIKTEYVKDRKIETREHGTISEDLVEFPVDYPNEYITAVGGSYDDVSNHRTVLITSLTFKTSYGRTSPKLGITSSGGREFMFEDKNGGKLLGFHGRSGQALDAIGPHFLAANIPITTFKPQGGNGGDAWDDGDFEGVRNISVGTDNVCVTYISTEYEKDNKLETREHGKVRQPIQKFAVDYPNEYITSVGGSYAYVAYYGTVLIKSLIFTTSTGRTSPTFGIADGTKFVFEQKGLKLVGLSGRSGDAIDALGAHFALATQKIGPVGGNMGDAFDDGFFQGVKKITVWSDKSSVNYIKIEYQTDGKVITREHGKMNGTMKEFAVDYPYEYITAVGGTYNHNFSFGTTVITSLLFTLSNGRTSPRFGEPSGPEFTLRGKNGAKLLGFFGRSGHVLDAIGASFEPQGREGGH